MNNWNDLGVIFRATARALIVLAIIGGSIWAASYLVVIFANVGRY
ncbi:hypothetical protein [Methylorubrum salsuginis]|uniref:Uncharacterized protein n=1 Tax=Methylorubrum salsuginis TaxID=414703 RepID=A0A1I4FLT5_9HYPH|nr:hypothetical protein [Methylorubrum salsuginis]SFL18895.1 hypothetical protein SAMN04488125_110112 [Methylorubrum salsuginis]